MTGDSGARFGWLPFDHEEWSGWIGPSMWFVMLLLLLTACQTEHRVADGRFLKRRYTGGLAFRPAWAQRPLRCPSTINPRMQRHGEGRVGLKCVQWANLNRGGPHWNRRAGETRAQFVHVRGLGRTGQVVNRQLGTVRPVARTLATFNACQDPVTTSSATSTATRMNWRPY